MAETQTLEDELRAANEVVYKHSLELARLKKELEEANSQQENLLHFISHEIKGFLTEGQNAFAGIVEGDYGDAPPQLRALAQAALLKMRAGVDTVMNILDASNLKKGTVSYKKEPYNFNLALEEALRAMQPKADEKHLTLTATVDKGKMYDTLGDADKIQHHVIRNLVDNAIRYTPHGAIEVGLTAADGKIRFSVKDTGVGITNEDMQRLFTEGGHGKESIKVNVDSTGYGLFIAKQVVEAHGGRIWAESAGAGKGSEFIVELPTT
jgi:signal transduction histidine kinase